MLKKGSKLYSILTGSCPKCHEESMYLEKNPYKLNDLYKMHETCSHCHTRYLIEPSFFYGAMYVSYGLNVAIGILTFIIVFQFDRSMITSFISIFLVLILSFPIVMRMSRNIYINLFVTYKPEGKK